MPKKLNTNSLTKLRKVFSTFDGVIGVGLHIHTFSLPTQTGRQRGSQLLHRPTYNSPAADSQMTPAVARTQSRIQTRYVTVKVANSSREPKYADKIQYVKIKIRENTPTPTAVSRRIRYRQIRLRSRNQRLWSVYQIYSITSGTRLSAMSRNVTDDIDLPMASQSDDVMLLSRCLKNWLPACNAIALS